MGKRSVVRVSGPLGPYADGFESWLTARGYSRSAVGDRLTQFGQLSRWLEREGLATGELTAARAAEFVAARREAGYVTWVAAQSPALPLGYLRGLGVVPLPSPRVAEGPLEVLLDGFCRYLVVERGLSERTRMCYVPAARVFLAGRQGPGGLALERLCAADVSLFLAAAAKGISITTASDNTMCFMTYLLFRRDHEVLWVTGFEPSVRL